MLILEGILFFSFFFFAFVCIKEMQPGIGCMFLRHLG